MLVVVSYDVSTTSGAGRKRLRRISKACLNYGQRVQNSVFECVLGYDTWTTLRLQLLDEINPDEDSLRFYFLGNNFQNRVEHHGTKSLPDLQGPLIL